MRKRNIVIILLVLAISIWAFLGFTRKKEPKYTTVEVARGQVIQTVSATGTVEAAKKLELSFVNSGRVKEINVKVGDYVKSGAVLAKLDTSQLESQLSRAKAALNASVASLNKLLEGSSPEEIRVSQTAVENAEIALENAKQNLTDVQASAEKEIKSAESQVKSAQISLDNALVSLDNTKISNENELKKVYDDAWEVVNSSLLTASDSLDTNKTTLEYKDAQDTLSVLNMQYLYNSSQSKVIAENSYNEARTYIDSIGTDPTNEEIETALTKIEIALKNIRKTLGDTSDVLQATPTSSKLSQTELDTLRANISTARTNVNNAISSLTASTHSIETQKIVNQTSLDEAKAAVDSAQSALDSAKKSLASVQASADAKIRSAQNAVKSKEGALKQAKDELELKKAGPRPAEVSLYKAKVRQAQAEINLIQNQIRDSVLLAPEEGTITEVNGEVGEIVTPAKTFISIITVSNFEIKANISEVDIAKVKVGDKVRITFDALGTDKEFSGKVVKIDPAETVIAGVIYYKVTTMFVGESDLIKPGMTANLDITTAKKNNVIMIPFSALKEKDGRKYVQVLENGKVKDVFVEVGLKGDINVEVIKGLVEGQKVITFVEEE